MDIEELNVEPRELDLEPCELTIGELDDASGGLWSIPVNWIIATLICRK